MIVGTIMKYASIYDNTISLHLLALENKKPKLMARDPRPARRKILSTPPACGEKVACAYYELEFFCRC